MLTILSALALAVPVQQSQAFEAEAQTVLAGLGEGAQASIWIEESTESGATVLLDWSTPKPVTINAGYVLNWEDSELRLTAAELANRARKVLAAEKELGLEAGWRHFIRKPPHPLLGTQCANYDMQDPGDTVISFQVGSWTLEDEELLYVAMTEVERGPPKSIQYAQHTELLLDAALTAVRRAKGTLPAEFERRGAFVPTPPKTPINLALVGSSLWLNTSLEFVVAAVDPSEGAVVADLACGNAHCAEAVFRALGPKGRLLARDVKVTGGQGDGSPGESRERNEFGGRYQLRQANRDDVCIEPQTLDLAYFVQSADEPRRDPNAKPREEVSAAWLVSLWGALKPGGEVVVVQYLWRSREVQPFANSLVEKWVAAGFEPGRRWGTYNRSGTLRDHALVFEFRRPE